MEEAKKMGMDLIKKKGGEFLSKLSGGIITTVPTSIDEAKQMGMDLIKKKGGELLSKMTGGLFTEDMAYIVVTCEGMGCIAMACTVR